MGTHMFETVLVDCGTTRSFKLKFFYFERTVDFTKFLMSSAP